MNSMRKKLTTAALAVVVFTVASAPVFAEGTVAAGKRSGDGPGAAARPADQERVQAPVPPAERYLSRLTAKTEKARKLGGGLGMGLGVLSAVIGVAMLGQEDDWFGLNKAFGTAFTVMGGVSFAGGALALSTPSPAEKSYKKILPIEDPVRREEACAEALAGLAKKGRSARMISAGVIGAMGAVSMLFLDEDSGPGGYITIGASAAAIALVQLLVKSPAERTYRAYLKESGVGNGPEIVVGLGPRGGFRAGLSLDF